mgnify:FL=1
MALHEAIVDYIGHCELPLQWIIDEMTEQGYGETEAQMGLRKLLQHGVVQLTLGWGIRRVTTK